MRSSAENQVDYVVSDGNVSLGFDSRICTPIASLQPKNATDPSVVCENAGSEF